jgi:glycosyltransferase involved in cell wall biosynthesis
MENLSDPDCYRHFSLSKGDFILKKILNALIDNVRLVAACLRFKTTCVHVNPSFDPKALFRDGLFVFTVSLFRLGKVLVFFHGWDPRTEERIRGNKFWRFLFTSVFRRATLTLVLGSTFKRSLVDLGFEPDRVQLITTMFDGRYLPGSGRVTAGNSKNILFLSRFVKEKGVYEVVDAFSVVSSDYPEARLILAGDGPEMGGLRLKIEELGLADRVSMPGYLADGDKARVLTDSELFVFPTRHGEGCPVALLEAMAAGQAVITTMMGGIPDIFRDVENGILLPAVTEEAIVEAMKAFLGNDQLRADVGNRNREYAWENFEARIVTERIRRVYEQLSSA